MVRELPIEALERLERLDMSHGDAAGGSRRYSHVPTPPASPPPLPNHNQDDDAARDFMDHTLMFNSTSAYGLDPSLFSNPAPMLPLQPQKEHVKTETIESIRDALLDSIVEEVRKWPVQDDASDITKSLLTDDYMPEISRCKRDPDGAFPTVLHWIVGLMKVGTPSGHRFRAIKILAVLALYLDPQLLVEHGKGDTALHEALSIPKPEALALAWLMCRPPAFILERHPARANVQELFGKWTKYAGSAAGQINSNGETCLHLAIYQKQFELARHLVQIIKPSSLLFRRNDEGSQGRFLEGKGNTPIHDAVDHKNTEVLEPICSTSNPSTCANCSQISAGAQRRKTQVRALVEDLIKANKHALKEKNTADETPYLLLKRFAKSSKGIGRVATGLGDKAPDGKSRGGTGTAHMLDNLAVPTPKNPRNDAMIPSTDEVAEGSRRKALVSAPPKSGPSLPAGSKPAKSSLVRRDSGLVTPDGAKPSRKCSHEPKSFAQQLADLVWEMAFTIGDFNEACRCLFGNIIKKPKTSYFAPGHAVVADMLSSHRYLDFTSVMSEVVLKVEPILPPQEINKEGDENAPPNTSPDSTPLLNYNEIYLKEIFDAIREKKVEKILKVTVEDDIGNPCTDEVIEYCLSDLDVRYLDWRKPDLNPDVVLRAAPNVVGLKLYSKCNTALRGWAAPNGLCNLNLMTNLTIDAKRGPEEYGRYYRDVSIFEQELQSLMSITRAKRLISSKNLVADYSYMRKWREMENVQRTILNDNVAPGDLVKLLQDGDPWKHVPLNPTETKNFESRPASYKQKFERLHLDMQLFQLQIDQNDVLLRHLERNRESLEENRMRIIQKFSQAPVKGSVPDSEIAAWDTQLLTLRYEKPAELNQASIYPLATRAALVANKNGLPSYVAADFNLKMIIDDPPKSSSGGSTIIVAADDPSEIKGPVKPHQWIKAVKDFTAQYNTIADSDIEIKLALIDDGVTTLEEALGNAIGDGWPNNDPWNRNDTFYDSLSGHGTLMAKLIIMMCPWVKLYVAKLGSWKQSADRIESLKTKSTATIAKKAVDWAISENVDIISMSWSLVDTGENTTETEALGSAISTAMGAENKIIAYCAASDESMYGEYKKLYPAHSDTKGIKTIGSSKSNGKPSDFVNEDKVDYLLPGQDHSDLPVDFREGGSSAATALAAGLAALILWCYAKDAGPNWESVVERVAGWENMHKIFKGMKTDQTRFIDVTALLKHNNKVANVAQVVSKCNAYILQG